MPKQKANKTEFDGHFHLIILQWHTVRQIFGMCHTRPHRLHTENGFNSQAGSRVRREKRSSENSCNRLVTMDTVLGTARNRRPLCMINFYHRLSIIWASSSCVRRLQRNFCIDPNTVNGMETFSSLYLFIFQPLKHISPLFVLVFINEKFFSLLRIGRWEVNGKQGGVRNVGEEAQRFFISLSCLGKIDFSLIAECPCVRAFTQWDFRSLNPIF